MDRPFWEQWQAAIDRQYPDLRRELIRLEVAYRRRGGESPQPKEYLDRFPELDMAWLTEALTPPPHERETESPERPDGGW